MTTRTQRRAQSRDHARTHPVAPKPSRDGEISRIIHGRQYLTSNPEPLHGGQQRRNHKRNTRAEYWRTVKIRVPVQFEPYFRQHLHLLGTGSRIQGRTLVNFDFAVDLDVHIPGAPTTAVRADPIWRSVRHHNHYVPELDHVQWTDADGQWIETEADNEQQHADTNGAAANAPGAAAP